MIEDIQNALDRIAKTGVAMEVNTSGTIKALKEIHPMPIMLLEMRKRNIPVVLGSDAHAPERVCADFMPALTVLEEAGYEEISYYRNRKRRTIPIFLAKQSLRTYMPVDLLKQTRNSRISY